MSTPLRDPLDLDSKVKQCAACDNDSSTYSGRFAHIPRKDEVRQEWLIRIGTVKPGDPLPIVHKSYVCQDHFDFEHDFKKSALGCRLRTGILPWRNLRTGTFSYHGLDRPAPDLEPSNLERQPEISEGRSVGTQTEGSVSEIIMPQGWLRKPILEAPICRLCFQHNNLTALFSANKPENPELLDTIYETTGLLLIGSKDSNAHICRVCIKQIGIIQFFTRQVTSRNNKFMLESKQKEEMQGKIPLMQARKKRKFFKPPESRKVLPSATEEPEQIIVKVEPTEVMVEFLEEDNKCLLPDGKEQKPKVEELLIKHRKTEEQSAPSVIVNSTKNLCTDNKRLRIVDFEEFKSVLAKTKRIKES